LAPTSLSPSPSSCLTVLGTAMLSVGVTALAISLVSAYLHYSFWHFSLTYTSSSQNIYCSNSIAYDSDIQRIYFYLLHALHFLESLRPTPTPNDNFCLLCFLLSNSMFFWERKIGYLLVWGFLWDLSNDRYFTF